MLALAAGLAAWHMFLAVQWWRHDVQPPSWDPAVHLGTTLDYKEAAASGDVLGLLLTKPKPGHPQYPAAYHYSLLPVMGTSAPHRAVVFVNLAYFFLLLGAIAWLAFMAGGEPAAVAALAVAGFSPGLLYKYREVFPDVALAAWTTLAYAFVLRSKGFAEKSWSYAAGAAAGLAVLSKWGAVLYLAPLVVWGLRKKNFWRALGVAAAMALPWYLLNTATMLPRIWTSVNLGHSQGHPLTWTLNNWLYYPRWLADCFTLPGLLLLLAGCALALRKRTPAKLALAGWLGFSYLFCTLVPSKDHRYFLPAAGALPALGLAGLPPPALAAAAALTAWKSRERRRPDASEWHNEAILAEIEPGSTLCLLANHRALNSTSLSYLARARGQDVRFGGHQTSELPEWSDYVLVKTAEPGAYMSDVSLGLISRASIPGSFFNKVFEARKRWALPDGSEAVLYAQRPGLKLLSGARKFPELSVRGSVLRGVTIKQEAPGRYSVGAESLELKKLPQAPIRGIKAELLGARLLEDKGKVYVLGLEKARLLSARQNGAELHAALAKRSGLPAEWFKRIALSAAVEAGAVSVKAGLFGLSWTLSVPLPTRPFALELAPLNITPEELSIGA